MSQIEKVRERVLQLARDIEAMSHKQVPPDHFFQEFLRMVVTAIGAEAGAVWLVNDQNRLGMIAGLNMENILPDQNAFRLNEKLLIDVMQTGEACTHAPEDDNDVNLPSRHVYVLSGIHKNKEPVGVVELFQRENSKREARPGYLQFLEQMCGYASNYLDGKYHRKEEATQTSQFWKDFEQFTLRMQRSLETPEVCDAAASDGRLLLGCDRLSVAVKKGRKVSIQAVSGQTSVNHRANLIRTMAALSKRVIAMGDDLLYTGKIDSLAPQIEKPLANFVQESTSRMVKMIPLFPPEPLVEREEDKDEQRKKRKKRRKAFACLVAEQVAESQPVENLEERLEIVAEHTAAAMWNARQHERIFLRSVWKTLGRIKEWFHGRKLAITTAVIAAIVAVGAALVYIPWDYRVEASGKLMPVNQFAVFAPMEGRIPNIELIGGQEVTEGSILIELENDRLEREKVKKESEARLIATTFRQYKEQYDSYQGGADPEKRDQANSVYTKMLESRVELDGALLDIENLDAQIARLKIVAPITGIVPDMHLKQTLQNRPVDPGQLLLHILDHKGDWHLELKVEDKRMGHINKALKELVDEGKPAELPVEFIPATEYSQTYTGVLKVIGTRAIPDQELGNVFELIVIPDANADIVKSKKTIGAQVKAKITCGKRSLGYVLFGDVIEFVQKYLWL